MNDEPPVAPTQAAPPPAPAPLPAATPPPAPIKKPLPKFLVVGVPLLVIFAGLIGFTVYRHGQRTNGDKASIIKKITAHTWCTEPVQGDGADTVYTRYNSDGTLTEQLTTDYPTNVETYHWNLTQSGSSWELRVGNADAKKVTFDSKGHLFGLRECDDFQFQDTPTD